jgi:peroxin-1
LTDSFSPTDLHNLVQRTLHLHFLQSDEQLGTQSFEKALHGFKTQLAQGVKLYEPPRKDMGWKDVGGLEEVKRILVETLEFPIMYGSLFQKAPINLRSGLLLYGYPGCGKTHIVNCLANVISEKVKFLMVKGPELLNKYIGASEQAVRDVFQKAKSIAPCVVFFDEFDALAQQRGTSDQGTGVTDRVVNQLLCELDGVEGRGDANRMVYVIAATSRPDMIDVALLRPGRLDKSLFCSMPDREERKQILMANMTQIQLDDDQLIEELANKTEYFTGADLQALVYSATLLSAHEQMSALEKQFTTKTSEAKHNILFEGKRLDKELSVQIQQQAESVLQNRRNVAQKSETQEKNSDVVHLPGRFLLQALSESRPSLRRTEREKLHKIYKFFSNEETKEVPREKKVTLA